MKVQWTKFAIVLVLYLAFLLWVQSWLGLVVVPFIYDVYITKKIRWQWWKDSEGPVRFIMSWVDALVFALVAVYFINLFFFQNYVIPSSSLEKSLLTGDYLFVSKVSYGPRIPQTPLTMPLTQHTMPLVNVKKLRRVASLGLSPCQGLGKCKAQRHRGIQLSCRRHPRQRGRYQACDYYHDLVYPFGEQILEQNGWLRTWLTSLLCSVIATSSRCTPQDATTSRVCPASMATSSAVLQTVARTT